jgi:hypothetical protein
MSAPFLPGFLCTILTARIPPVPTPTQANPPATIESFEADRFVVKPGEAVAFTWTTRDADSVRLEPLGATLPPSGTLTDHPRTTTVYWLSVANVAGGESWPLQVSLLGAVEPPSPARAPVAAPGRPAHARPAPAAGSGFWVQFAALKARDAAELLAERLGRKLAEPVTVETAAPAAGGGPTYFRVHAGPYAGRAAAAAHLRAALGRLEPGLPRPIVVEGSPPLPGDAAPRTQRHRRHRRRPPS